MSAVQRLIELAGQSGREVAERLPARVLDLLAEECGAGAGALGEGDTVLARRGGGADAAERIVLPAGRDSFWLSLGNGAAPDEQTRKVAAIVLASWRVREELKSARFAERRRLWEVESLRAIAEALGGTLEPGRIAEELLLHATALLDARRGEVWLGDEVPIQVRGAQSVGRCADGSCTVAARIGGPVLTAEEAASLPHGGVLEADRLAVPIVGRRGRIGALAIAEREVRGGTAPFGSTDSETLNLFAAQAAVALENAHLYREEMERQRLARELELAAAIQRQILPRSFPRLRGAEIAARTLPSRQVGGDIYDVIPAAEGDAAVIMLADLSGKGVPAALMASSLHAAVHILAPSGTPVAELATRLHAHLLHATPDNKYATVFLARLAADGTLEYVSAGHNPAILVRPGGAVELLGATGTPLGLLHGVTYSSQTVTLPPDSMLVVYTDGFTEAPATRDGEDFGVERLADLVASRRDEPLESVLDGMFDAVDEFTGGALPHDDRTALVVRRHDC